MKRAIIFCNGDLSDVSPVRKYISKNTLLIGCDGGASHILSLGKTPDVVIGDFDSLSRGKQKMLTEKGVRFIRYPKDKIYTDSELGLMFAQEQGCGEIIITGIRGTHTDHLFANLALLAKKKYTSLDMKIIDGKETITLVRKRIRIRGKTGDTVSLIAIRSGATGVVTKGLFYPLKNGALAAWSAQGLRNHLTSTRAEITLQKGALLLIHQKS